MTEPIPSRPPRAPRRPSTNADEKLVCVYCNQGFFSGDSLWDHTKRDHATEILRHRGPGELESLKPHVIDASKGKQRRHQKSKGVTGRPNPRPASEAAPSSPDMNGLTLEAKGRRYRMTLGNLGSIHSRRAPDHRSHHPRRPHKKLEGSDPMVVSEKASPSDGQTSDNPPSPTDSTVSELLRQPLSKEISEDQLSQEVKSIYAGLTAVEAKCIRVCDPQTPIQPKTGSANTHTHYQALIALHRTLLHEHHDFLLASQHPLAGSALRDLALKYSMPARMWKHGIFSFLELLRHRLPETMDYLLSFLILAYQMIALLYETVPKFQDTWIECLGDLARYRMAIDETRDRDTWQGVARHWYTKAASRNPHVGRLFHHLAILARPRLVEQLYFYCRSLTCDQSFRSSRESIRSLFDPLYPSRPPLAASDTTLVQAHRSLFERTSTTPEFGATVGSFLGLLDDQIGRTTTKWKEQGSYIAIINITALFDYGSPTSSLCSVFQMPSPTAEGSATTAPDPGPSRHDPADEETLVRACRLLFSTFRLVLQRRGDYNVLPHINLVMEFLYCSIVQDLAGTSVILQRAPWDDIASFLNRIRKEEKISSHVEEEAFPEHNQPDKRPLPEDFLAQGQIWCARRLFPDDWFEATAHFDEEERSMEHASMTRIRLNRIAWLGIRIAQKCRWIRYDSGMWSAQPTMQLAPDQPHASPEGQDVIMTDAPAAEHPVNTGRQASSPSNPELPTEKGSIERVLRWPRNPSRRYPSSIPSPGQTPWQSGKISTRSKPRYPSKSGSPPSGEIQPSLVDWKDHAG